MAIFTLATLSLANSARDEATEYRLGSRLADLIRYYIENPVDVLVVSEIRKCRSSVGTHDISAIEIIRLFSYSLGMEYVFVPNNLANDMAFNKAIFYNPVKFICTSFNAYWPMSDESCSYPSGPQFCQSILEANLLLTSPEYYDAKGEYIAEPISYKIVNIHTPVNADGRKIYFSALKSLYRFTQENLIMAGDYNLITEFQGLEHEAYLELYFKNWTKDIGTTFRGFPHDRDSNGIPYESSLDRIFTNMDFTGDIDVKAIDLVKGEKRLSDHYSLHATI
jgi:hypothetical protein